MESQPLWEKVHQLEQELQLRRPSVGSGLNAPSLNYTTAPAAPAAAATTPFFGFSLVTNLREEGGSNSSSSTSGGSSSLLELSDNSDVDDEAADSDGEEADSRFVDVSLSDDVTDGSSTRSRIAAAAAAAVAAATRRQRPQTEFLEEFVEVAISDTKHPHAELPAAPPDLSGARLRRRQIFATLLSTEASYLASLKELMLTFQQPLLQHRPKLLPRRHVRAIFHKIPELHQIHRILQISLHAAACSWDQSERVGHVLAASFSKSLVLKTYASFLNNYTRAVSLLRRLMEQNAAFATFVSGVQSSSRHKLPLLGIFVKPVQRFPQLLLVVKDLLRHTHSGHPDRYDLLYAQTQIESLTEQLNEIKRHSEEVASAKQQLKALGVKSKSVVAGSGVRLVRDDAVVELRPDARATQQSTTRLLLTSFCVVCTAAKRQGGQQQLLWFARLEDVKLSSNSLTPEMRVSLEEVDNVMRIISQRNRHVPAELEEIYESLLCLIHDHAVMVKVLSLVTSLKYIYPEAREEQLGRLVANMQVAIQQKSQELRVAQGTVLSLSLRQRKSAKVTKHSFDLPSAAAHDAWVSEFTTLQLALQPQNNAAWVTDSAEELRALAHRCPLLVGVRACDLGRSSFRITCATDVCLLNGCVLKTHLWCCASDGSVTICSLYEQSLEVTETFQAVDVGVTAVAVVPGGGGRDDEVWMAAESCEIFVHSVAESRRRQPRRKIDVDSCVRCLLHHDGCVLCGDSSGGLVCFRRGLGGDWNLRDPETLQLAHQPIRKLVVAQDGRQLLACAGYELLTLDLPDLRVSRRARLCDGDEATASDIRDFLLLGDCVWVCFEGRPVVRLYFCPDMRLVQSFDLQPAYAKLRAARGQQQQQQLLQAAAPSATSLAATRGLLWVGTSEGLLYLLRLPRLDSGVPAAYGPPLISCHCHSGPHACLLTFRNIKDTIVSSVTFSEEEQQPQESPLSSSCDSDGSDCGVYQLQLSSAASADAPEAAAGRRPTVAKLTVAPEMQRWASHPNLLLSEQQQQQQQQQQQRQQQQQQQQQEVRRLYGSLLDVSCADDFPDADGEAAAYQQELEDSPQLSDIAEEPEGVADVADAAPAAISHVGPQLLVSIGVGYRDMLRRPACGSELGPSIMAFYAV